MADVFISYKSEDRAAAGAYARALDAEGLSVWWDPVLRTGETYDEVIERNLREAAVVVVLWSPRSVKSKWVRAEATIGERKGGLLPVLIEACDRPIAFELTQTADLMGWSGNRADARWRAFVGDLREALATRQAHVRAHTAQPPPDPLTIETLFWSSIKDGSDVADFDAYLQRYPHGHFVELARGKARVLLGGVTKTRGGARPWLIAGAALVALAMVVGALLWPLNGAEALPDARTTPASVRAPIAPEHARFSDFGLFRDCEHCPEMVVAPAGSFIMGSPRSEWSVIENERPQHTVAFAAPFAVSRFELTFDEWDACVSAGGCNGVIPDDQGWGHGRRPVLNVSWRDAHAYLDWLSRVSGKQYRLLSEAEWEYVARAGTSGAYVVANREPMCIVSNSDGTTTDTCGQMRSNDVGQFAPNGFGLFDMNGNASELVEDCLHDGYVGAPQDGSVWAGGDCNNRVFRGGSFIATASDLRWGLRSGTGPGDRNWTIGFRVARDLGG